MHKVFLITLVGLSLSCSAFAKSSQEIFKQMNEQRQANGNKVLKASPKVASQTSPENATLSPFQKQLVTNTQRLLQDGIFTNTEAAQLYAKEQMKATVVKIKDGYRSGDYIQSTLCHTTDEQNDCLNNETLKGKRPSNAYLRGFFPSNMTYTKNIKEMTTNSRVKQEVQPWSDDYWAIDSGILGYRYATYHNDSYGWEESVNFVLSQDGHLSNILNMEEGSAKELAIDMLSPSEKYDLLIGTIDELNYTWIQWTDAIYQNGENLVGKVGGFLTPQQWIQGQSYFDRNGNVESWMGICHGWAAAAIQLERPKKPVQVIAADGKTKITFYPAEIKSLASYLWANSAPKGSRFIGGRCNDKEVEYDELSGAILDTKCFDTNPGDWHTVISNYIGTHQRSFVMDVTFDYEVWNQPVLGYEVTFSNPMSDDWTPYDSVEEAAVLYSDYKSKDIFRDVREASTNTKYIVNVNMKVEYLVENKPSQRGIDGPNYDEESSAYYTYDLELDANYNIIGGEWHTNDHPDFLWSYDAGQKARARVESKYTDGGIRDNMNFSSHTGATLTPALQDVAQKAARQGEVFGTIVEALIEAAQ